MKERAQHFANVFEPLRTLIVRDASAAASLDALHQLVQKEQERRDAVFAERSAGQSLQLFSFTANPGFQIIAPPYDLDWSSQPSVLPVWGSDKNTGKIKVLQIQSGATGAAVGVILSSPVRSLVRVAPFAPYTYQWSGFDKTTPAGSSGSAGIVVYINEDSKPAYDHRTELWNVHFDFPGFRDRGSNSSTIGRDLSRDVLISMEPGSSYQVWVWCSIVAHIPADFLGYVAGQIECDVPFFVIDAGPPLNIR